MNWLKKLFGIKETPPVTFEKAMTEVVVEPFWKNKTYVVANVPFSRRTILNPNWESITVSLVFEIVKEYENNYEIRVTSIIGVSEYEKERVKDLFGKYVHKAFFKQNAQEL